MKNGFLTFTLILLCAFILRAQTTAAPPASTASSPITSTATATATPAPALTVTPAAASETHAVAASSSAPANSSDRNSNVALAAEKSKPVRIMRFDKPPVIDGRLDEAMWQGAVALKDFYQINPGDNIAPSKPTEVLLGYDSKFLYIAFRAFDEAGKVRATIAKRDSIFNDDYVGFFLDTFNDQRKAFEMFFNPLGVQADGVLTEGRGEDFSVDVLMESKGTLTENGYTVEIAIPFKSLRYEAGKDKLWGAHFFRRIQRFNSELDSWMPISRSNSSNLGQAGHITGLEGISTERTIELIPSLTLSETGKRVRSIPAGVLRANPDLIDQGRFVNEPVKFDPGLTAKFGISSTVTLDLALNPDFAQVEADQLVVTANQRFPVFFPEKRPFFLEGIDIFNTNLTVVHTRAIVDPDVAIKLTGKRGRNTFGFLVASDNGPGNFIGDERLDPRNFRFLDKNAYIGVLRLKRDIGKGENTIGVLATTYNFIEKHNNLAGFDGRFRLDKQRTFDFQVVGTTSQNFFFDPDLGKRTYRTGNGLGYSIDYNNSGRNWGTEFYGEGYTRDYRADVGFFGRRNSNFNSLLVRYNSDRKPKAKLISYHLHNFTHLDYDFQGRLYIWESEFAANWNFPRNSFIGLAYEYAYERLFEEEFGQKRTASRAGAFFGEDNERSSNKNHFFVSGGSQYSKKIQFNFRGVYRDGHFDLDFGNGRKYPRVSAAALLDPKNPNVPLDPGPGGLFEFNGSFTYQPTDALRMSLGLIKNRLVRHDTRRTAYDVNILTYRGTYQFTRATFARAILDYNTLNSRVRGQFLLGWTPSPGTALFAGYNDDANFGGYSPINGLLEPGFRRNGRTLFIKMSYLFRRSV